MRWVNDNKSRCHMNKLLKKALCLSFFLLTICCSSNNSEEIVNDEPRLNQSDSLALVSIYQEIGPWLQEWDLNDITTWNGVQTALNLETNEIRVIGFEVYNGNFRGTFPEEFCQLTELRRLVLGGGQMGGSIPNNIGKLKNLIYLCVAGNNVGGYIPESIGELTKLQELQLMDNQICGSIPESIGNLVNLEYLYICRTLVSGELPKSLANLNKLQIADLHKNRLSGVFPIEILKDSVFIECEDNNITELPFEVWNDSLTCIPPVLKRNRLSGLIPEWVKETKKWNKYASICISLQQKNYGYSNYSHKEEN